MKMLHSLRGVAATLLAAMLVLASSSNATACAACYNAAGDDRMTNAAAVGIFAMVIIMFLMLGAVAAFGFHLAYRAKHPLPDYDELLGSEQPPAGPGDKS